MENAVSASNAIAINADGFEALANLSIAAAPNKSCSRLGIAQDERPVVRLQFKSRAYPHWRTDDKSNPYQNLRNTTLIAVEVSESR
jgi:hypothetical protein